MSTKKKGSGAAMENARTMDPLEPRAGTPSQRSRLHAATAIQSSVRPEDYPPAERDAQVDAATGTPKTGR